MKTTVRHLWENTSQLERVTTLVSVAMPVLAVLAGRADEALVWVVAALWWGMYLRQKLVAANLRHQLWLSRLVHEVYLHAAARAAEKARHRATRPTLRIPRGHHQ